ncbi:MAG: polymer-forming cytoskeletal protein [Gemmatimonadota bacterium]|nr:polymer-forming cytoskeletal protein [Gemmatimonadota bacterium]
MDNVKNAVVLGPVALVVAAAACGPGSPTSEEARFRSGGDLIAAGARVELSDSVTGDVMGAGRIVRFTGTADGSFLGIGSTQRLEGTVRGSFRAVGGAVRVNGRSDRNTTLLGADVRLEEGADVGLNAYLVGGRIRQQGTVRGHLRVAGTDVVLDGPVAGNVDVIARSFTLGPSARIEGDLTYRAREGQTALDPAATVAGDVSAVTVPGPSLAFTLLFGGARAAAFLLVGALALLVVPALGGTAARLNERPLAALGLGLLWLIAIPVFAGAAFVTVVGIPLAVITATLYVVALYLAPVVPSRWLGSALLDSPGSSPTPPVRAFLVGGVPVAVLLLLPWVGAPARILATAVGFGAVVLAIRGRLDRSASADGG